MNVLSIISLVLSIVYLQLGIYVLSKGVKTRLNQIFFLLSFCFSVWSFGYAFLYSAASASAALFWVSVASFGYCFFPAFMVYFKLRLCNCFGTDRVPFYIFSVLFVWGGFLFIMGVMGYWRPEGIEKTAIGYWKFVQKPGDIFYQLYYLYLLVSGFITFWFLIRWRFRTEDNLEVKQFNIYFYSLLFFVLLGTVLDLALPGLDVDVVPQMGHISSLPWIGGIAFSIIYYQLMGLNVNYLISENIVKQIREIIIFIDLDDKIVRSNSFTGKLLGKKNNFIEGKQVFDFFENKTLLSGYISRVKEKEQIGPLALSLKDDLGNHIESSLYFIAIRDRFDDLQGVIIYGHDNGEAISLQKEIIIRKQAEKNLRAISEVLETRVKERTVELTNSYKELQVKMTERMRVEEQIKADIYEKEVLINEIHNRVKSNMDIIISLILANDKGNLPAAASKKFKELARRVKSLLLVHNNLYLSINYSDVDFGNFIKTLINELLVFHKRKDKVQVRLNVKDVFLDVDYAIPMGIVVNELIANALQHAFTDHFMKKHNDKQHVIDVSYTFENNSYELSVADNGKGLPKNFDLSELTTNGLPLSEILVNDQVNGKIEYFSSEKGTLFKIIFHAEK